MKKRLESFILTVIANMDLIGQVALVAHLESFLKENLPLLNNLNQIFIDPLFMCLENPMNTPGNIENFKRKWKAAVSLSEAAREKREAIRALEDAEGKVDAAARTAKHYKEQRDAAVKQLRKIADCSTCRKDRPEGVDGPECVACTRGQNWEWNGGKA